VKQAKQSEPVKMYCKRNKNVYFMNFKYPREANWLDIELDNMEAK
jgi:hypothetical protein